MTSLELERQFSIGAEVANAGTHFRVWAPRSKRVSVRLAKDSELAGECSSLALAAEGDGYFSGETGEAAAGGHYKLELDHGLFPDPASRFQPEGPHGASQIVDPRHFSWSDAEWRGRSDGDRVIYEMHIGTFTREGTWCAAAGQLPELAALGITTLEMMPVADFPGRYGWGYDGVCLFAPTRLYGEPDDLAQREEIAVHLVDVSSALPVGKIEFAAQKSFLALRVRKQSGGFRRIDAGKLAQKLRASGGDQFGQLGIVICEIQKGRRRGKFLTLEKHGGAGAEQQQRGERAGAAGIAQIEEPPAPQRVRDLVMVLHEMDEVPGVQIETGTPPPRFLPNVTLTLIQIAPLGGGNEFLRHAAVIRIVGLVAPSQRDDGTVMKIVIPERIEAITTFLTGAHQLRMLRFIFTDHIGAAALGNGRHGPRDGRQDVLFRRVEDLLRGVEAQAIEMEFADPVSGVGEEKLAHRLAVGAVEVERFAPVALIAFAEIVRREFRQIIPIGAEMVVDDIENDLETDGMRAIDEGPKTDPLLGNAERGTYDGASLAERAFLLRFFGRAQDDRLLIFNFGPALQYSPAPEPLLAPPDGSQWELAWSTEDPKYGGNGITPLETEQDNWRIPADVAALLISKPWKAT